MADGLGSAYTELGAKSHELSVIRKALVALNPRQG